MIDRSPLYLIWYGGLFVSQTVDAAISKTSFRTQNNKYIVIYN